jgi:hypothetical protein
VFGLCVFCLMRSTDSWIFYVLFGEIHKYLDFVCFVWRYPQVFVLCVFSLVRSACVWMVCVLFGEIHGCLDCMCFVL